MLCPDCAAPTAPGARFCHVCGRRLDTLAEGLEVGDRRVVTALFADIVGYTRLVDELDPEEVRARVDGALSILGRAVVHFGGEVEKFIGDAVLAVFGVPVAHDDDALRACLCALEMQTALGRYGAGGDQPMELRIGIATGEVVAALREMAGTRSVALTGDPMTTAARLQQLAEPNAILLDDATVSAAEPRVGVDHLGERLLRGQRRPIAVHQLRGERRIISHPCRMAAPLIGRNEERARMVEMVRRTVATGHGGTIFLRGEAGVGKSRLLCEMEAEARAAGMAWTWLDNTPYGQEIPYRTVRAMVEWLADEQGVKAGILARQLLFGDQAPAIDADTSQLMLGAIGILARDSDMALLPEEGWDAGLPEMASPADFQKGIALVTQLWVSRMVEAQPRCVVIDDFHWIDPTSRVLTEIMIRMTGDLPLVVLSGARPPLMPDWVGLPFVDVIDLEGLDPTATEELATAIAGATLEAESARWLYQRTAGNALFVGEIMRTLRDTGRLEQTGKGVRIERGDVRNGLPLSLRALLGARIDALPPAQRGALEVASVIGMTFPEPHLLRLCGDSVSGKDLDELADAGMIAAAADDEPGLAPDQWRFRHQLFLDAAYGRLLADRRRALHGAVADLLEVSEPKADVAELARHRMAAGDGVRALPLLEQAAREAAAVGALPEAEAFARAAAEIRSRGPAGPVEANAGGAPA
jgi:class 3 adenylate cyclase